MTKTFQQFVQDLLGSVKKEGRLVIAVDGFGGSGKSTLARKLCAHIPNVGTVCVDDFLQPIVPGGENEFHWERFEQEVIEPLRNGKEIRYAPYSWKEKAFRDDVVIASHQPIIIEGVYSTKEMFHDAYDVRIWVDTPDHIRLERGIARDGEEMRELWENVWIPFQQDYFKKHQPHTFAHFIVDGAASNLEEDEIVIKAVTNE